MPDQNPLTDLGQHPSSLTDAKHSDALGAVMSSHAERFFVEVAVDRGVMSWGCIKSGRPAAGQILGPSAPLWLS